MRVGLPIPRLISWGFFQDPSTFWRIFQDLFTLNWSGFRWLALAEIPQKMVRIWYFSIKRKEMKRCLGPHVAYISIIALAYSEYRLLTNYPVWITATWISIDLFNIAYLYRTFLNLFINFCWSVLALISSLRYRFELTDRSLMATNHRLLLELLELDFHSFIEYRLWILCIDSTNNRFPLSASYWLLIITLISLNLDPISIDS